MYRFCFFHLQLRNLFLQISYFFDLFSTVNATFCRHRSFFCSSLQNLACNKKKYEIIVTLYHIHDQTLRKMGSKRPTNTVQQLIEPIKYVERILTTALFWMLRAWFAYFNVFRVSLRFVLAGLTQASINTKHC